MTDEQIRQLLDTKDYPVDRTLLAEVNAMEEEEEKGTSTYSD